MKRILCFFLLAVLCISLCSCNLEIQLPSSDPKPTSPACETCLSYLVGDWYLFTEDGNLFHRSYQKDGIYSFYDENGNWDAEEGAWKCGCQEDSHAVSVTVDGQNWSLKRYSPDSDGMEDGYLRDKGYTRVELTEDNWRDYFSDNADDVFEVVSLLTTEEIKNEWGEVLKNEYVYLQYITFKDRDRIAAPAHITVELDYASIHSQITVDTKTNTILSTAILDEEYTFSPITFTAEEQSHIEEGKCSVLCATQCYVSWTEEENHFDDTTLLLGEKIYRMKGWVLIKNAD